jgi:hypothetical protein
VRTRQLLENLEERAAPAVLTGGTDSGFVQSLYTHLLGRTASPSEVAAWLNLLPSLGRVGVASALLGSSECRSDAVEALYGFPSGLNLSEGGVLPGLLVRSAPPSAAEVNGWVSSGLDVLSMAAAIAGSSENFALASARGIV